MTAVSIIVPLHNSKKYLCECIDNILTQTLHDIEILCVDSSTDGTTDLLYAYREKDARIRVIEDSNGSYGHKLNVGIQEAAGEYIAIVESDDYIASDMMENMYNIAHKFQLDLIKSNYEGFIDRKEGRKMCFFGRGNAMIYDSPIVLKEQVHILPMVGHVIWTGLYRTQFLIDKGVVFHESAGASYQDAGFFILTALLSGRAYFIRDAFYKYRMDNEGSSVKSDKKYRCVTEEYVWLMEKMTELGCNDKADITFFKMMKLESYYWNYARLSEEYRKKFIESIADENLDDFDESVIGHLMPQKEKWIKLLKGDQNTVREFAEEEAAKKRLYKELYGIVRKIESIVIVGAGRCAELVLYMMDMAGYQGQLTICDNSADKQGVKMAGSIVCSVEEAVADTPRAQYIIANKRNHDALKKQIMDMGIQEEHIFINTCSDGKSVFFENFIKYCH